MIVTGPAPTDSVTSCVIYSKGLPFSPLHRGGGRATEDDGPQPKYQLYLIPRTPWTNVKLI